MSYGMLVNFDILTDYLRGALITQTARSKSSRSISIVVKITSMMVTATVMLSSRLDDIEFVRLCVI